MAPRLKNIKLRGRHLGTDTSPSAASMSPSPAYSLSIAEQNSALFRRRFQQVGKLLQTEIRKQGICRGTDARSAETAGLCRLYASFCVLHNECSIRLYAKELCRQKEHLRVWLGVSDLCSSATASKKLPSPMRSRISGAFLLDDPTASL